MQASRMMGNVLVLVVRNRLMLSVGNRNTNPKRMTGEQIRNNKQEPAQLSAKQRHKHKIRENLMHPRLEIQAFIALVALWL